MGQPNEQMVQHPISKKGFEYQAYQEVKPSQVDKLTKLGNHLVDTFGWGYILGFGLVGVLSIAGYLVRRKLKKMIGEPIKYLADWLNK